MKKEKVNYKSKLDLGAPDYSATLDAGARGFQFKPARSIQQKKADNTQMQRIVPLSQRTHMAADNLL